MNGLGNLRERLGYSSEEIAAKLKISLGALGAMEITPLGQLEVSFVSEYVGACGCRLDVVAVHIDGESIFLGDEEGRS